MGFPEKRVSASAQVTLTLVVDSAGSWGSDCTVEQIHKQASEDVISQVESMVNKSSLKAKIISAEVAAVLAARSR